MRQEKRITAVITIMQLIITLTLFTFSCHLADAGQPPAIIDWQLSGAKVNSWGAIATMKEGRMRTGIKIEAKADTSTPEAIFSEGIFHIDMTAFSPLKDMPGQKRGQWYLRGSWTITAKDADPSVVKARHNPFLLAGVLSTSLPFDPAVKSGLMEAQVRLQRGGTKPLIGRMPPGSYSGNSNFEGTLTIPFLPSAAKGKQTQE